MRVFDLLSFLVSVLVNYWVFVESYDKRLEKVTWSWATELRRLQRDSRTTDISWVQNRRSFVVLY